MDFARLSHWSHRAMLLLALYCFLGGLVSFLGWAFDVRSLTDWVGNGISIQPNTTIAAMASGIAIVLLALGYPTASFALGTLVALIGSTVLFEHIVDIDLGIDAIFLFDRSWGRYGAFAPGRMGPPG